MIIIFFQDSLHTESASRALKLLQLYEHQKRDDADGF
jgi:hypothetical protein